MKIEILMVTLAQVGIGANDTCMQGMRTSFKESILLGLLNKQDLLKLINLEL